MKRRTAAKISAIALAIVLVLIVAGLFIGRTQSFHRFVISKVAAQVKQTTGAGLQIGSYTFRWHGLRIDLSNVIVRGTEAANAQPLFRADHAEMSFKLVSLLQRKVDLSEVIVDRPIVHLAVDNRGNSNLPQPATPQKTGQTNVFDLGLQHFQLQQGEVYAQDEKLPLNAELYDLQLQVLFENASNAYHGNLSYAAGRIETPRYRPLQHKLQAEFHADRSQLRLDHLSLLTDAFTLEGTGRVDNYNDPTATLNYRLVLFTPQLARLVKSATVPEGDITLLGNLQYHNAPGAPLLQLIALTGKLSSPALAVRSAGRQISLQNLVAGYQVQSGTLQVNGLHANLLGGDLTGQLLVRNVTATPDAAFQLNVTGASLPMALSSGGVQHVPLFGRANLHVNAVAPTGPKSLIAQTAFTIQPGAGVRAQHGRWIPLFGAVHATYDSARNLITVSQSSFATPATSLIMYGIVDTHSNLKVQFRTSDLSELADVAAVLKTPGNSPGAKPLPEVHGAAAFSGSVLGSMSSPELRGALTGSNLQVQGSRWRSLRANVDLSPSLATIQGGDLQAASQGSIRFDARAALHNWSYLPANAISLRATAAGLPAADLERLANLQYPISGSLSANVNVSGSELYPVGQGNLQLVNGKIAGEPVQTLRLTFQGNGQMVDSRLGFRLPAGTGNGELRYFPRNQGYQANFTISTFQLNQLATVRSRDLQLSGVLDAKLTGAGTIKSPQLDAQLTIPVLKIRQQELTGIRAQLGVANHVASIALDSDLAGAYVRAHGTVNLDANEEASIAIDTRAIPLEPLLATYLPAQASDLRGQVELHGWLRGPLKQPALLQAQVQIPLLQLGYKTLDIHNAGPIRMDYRSGLLNLQPSELQGSGAQLRIGGSIPVKSAAPLSLDAIGSINLAVLQAVMSQVESAGQLQINLRANKPTGGEPGVQGNLRFVNAYLHSDASPLGLENLNGEILVQNDHITMDHLSADSGGGKVFLDGAVTYRPQTQFNLALVANSVRLRYPEGVRAVLDSRLTLAGTPAASALTGQVLINRLSLTRDFDMATFMDQFTGQAAPPSGSAFMQNLKLDVAVQSTEQLGLASSKLSMRGAADLRVTGSADDPVILGRANVNSGEIFFMGKRYEIENSVLDFNNPVRTEPTVNLRATTVVDQYNLSMNFVGPIDHLRTTYTSDPPLPPVDIINLLAFGSTTAASAASPSTPANLGAASVLAQGLTSQVSSRVEKLAGISQLSIDPNIGGNNQNPGARLAIQQRFTKNLLVTFATDVTSTQREVIQLEYHLTPRWSVRAVRDQNGGYAFDAHMHRTF